MHSILAAQKANLEGYILVDTDSEEIATIAKQNGANTPYLRPKELAQDQTPTLDVVLHALAYFEDKGVFFDAILLLQATSPFRPHTLINQCVEQFEKNDFDTLISVLPVPHEYNPHWVFEVGENQELKIATGEKNLIPRRQELPVAYHRDGSIYLVKTQFLKENRQLIGGKIGYFVTDKSYYCNLDTPDDWNQAEQMLNTCADLLA